MSSSPFLTHGEWVMSGLTFIYVGLTAFYAWTSHKTLKALEEQGRHAKEETEARDKQFAQQLKVSQDAATAASLNAQAIINSERPWILVSFDSHGSFDIPKQAHVNFKGRNCGRTPARVTRMCVVSYPQTPDAEFPEEPPYHETELAYPKYVAPGEPFHIEDFNLRLERTDAMWEEISKRRERLLFIGHVVKRIGCSFLAAPALSMSVVMARAGQDETHAGIGAQEVAKPAHVFRFREQVEIASSYN